MQRRNGVRMMKLRTGDYERDPESGLVLPRRKGVIHARPQFMAGPAFFGGGPRDPSFSAVSLLVLGEGANSGTVITDRSINALTPTSATNTITTTSDSQFGTSSLSLDTTQSFNALKYTGHAGLLFTGDFTLEASFKLSVRNTQYLFWIAETEAAGRCNISTGSAGDVRLNMYGGADVIINSGTGGSSVIPLNTWFDFSVVRSGTTITFRIGTTSIGSTTLSGTLGNGTGGLAFVGPVSTGTWLMANVRVTKGVARTISALSANFPIA